MHSLRVDKLSKSFKAGAPVLEEVSFEIEPGELVAAVGQSGSGKTTLLRLLAGFERPDSGTISLGGKTVVSDSEFVLPEKRNIGFVFQDLALFPHLSVAKNIAFGIKDKSVAAKRVQELIETVGLGGLEKRYPWQLSGGQQQRVAIARSLAPKPSVLLLDEPFSSLDQSIRFQVRKEIQEILKLTGTTAIIVTHDIEDAYAMANRMLVLDHGKLVQFDTPEQVYLKPVNDRVARLGGKLNLIDAESGIRNGESGIRNGESGIRNWESGKAIVRPEHVILTSFGDWKIDSVSFQGKYKEYQISKGEQRLLVHSPSDFEIGQHVGVDIHPENVVEL